MSIFKRIKSKKGFTLVELIIAITILSILMASMTPLLINSSKYLSDITARVKYQNAASNIMNVIRTQAGNTNTAYIYNGDEAGIDSITTGYAMFRTKSDYSAFVLKTPDGETPIISSKSLDGRKIKVDFECDKTVEAIGSTKRMAMLYVTVSVYEGDQDMSYFTTNPNATEYTRTITDPANPTKIKKEVIDVNAPKPVYQHTSGIYLINMGNSINVPNSRAASIKSGITHNLLPKPTKTDVDGNVVVLTDAEIEEEFAKDPLSNLGLNSTDIENLLKQDGYKQDYIGSCLMYKDVN